MARIHEHTVNIAAPLSLVNAIPLAMQGDSEADELRLHVVNGKKQADMTGYAVGGYLERADGIRVMLKGSVTADTVEVKLQEACYRVPGAYKAFVRLTKTTGEKMTLFLFAGMIENEGDGEIVDEEDTLPSVEELIAMIEEIDRATADAKAAATGADAAAAEALKAAENAGRAEKAANDAAYEANAAADAADEAAVGASAWAKATMEAESLPEGSTPTVTVEKNESGGNVIRVGIPAGRTGEAGATPQITFEVETGAAGSNVKVEQSGTAEAPHIKLTIPRGDTGAVEGVDYYEGDPEPLGEASPGTSNGLARGNHVHPMPSAADIGARPDTWTPTAEDVGALPAGGTAVNANKLNGKDAVYYLGARNLLDNSNFKDFIAQAGLDGTHGAVVYAGDRWVGNSLVTTTRTNGGVKFNSSDRYVGIRQVVKVRPGVPHAFAIKGTGGAIAIRVYDKTSQAEVGSYNGATFNGIVIAQFTPSEEYVDVWFYPGFVDGGGTATIEWAALYEGEYTADNLPPYVAPDPVLELAKCKDAYKIIYVTMKPTFMSGTVRVYRVAYGDIRPTLNAPTIEILFADERNVWSGTGATFTVEAVDQSAKAALIYASGVTVDSVDNCYADIRIACIADL